MDRSVGGKPAQSPPPPSSRLIIRVRADGKPKPNRRRPTTSPSVWARVRAAAKPAIVADACGRALRRSLPALIAAGVLGAIGGTAWAGYRFVTTSPRFAITEISIRGNHHLASDQIRATLPVALGDNVFATDLDTVVTELRTNPWIASAEAHRILPHTIVIDVREHEPAVLAELGGLYLVDANGHPFKRAALDADEGAGLPIITGLDRTAYLADPDATARTIAAALQALAQWRSAGSEASAGGEANNQRPPIGEVHVDAHGALTLHTFDQATAILLGPMDAALLARMRTFDAVWAQLGDAERTRARAIHLDTRPDHVTVAFAPQQKDQ
jgi:cell division protein FtsQ